MLVLPQLLKSGLPCKPGFGERLQTKARAALMHGCTIRLPKEGCHRSWAHEAQHARDGGDGLGLLRRQKGTEKEERGEFSHCPCVETRKSAALPPSATLCGGDSAPFVSCRSDRRDATITSLGDEEEMALALARRVARVCSRA